MDNSEGRSLSNMEKTVEEGDVVLVCEWHSPSTEIEMFLKEVLSPSNFMTAVVGGSRATYDTRFVVSRAQGGKADLVFLEGKGPEIFSISTGMLMHPPTCKVGVRAVVRDEYFRCLADAEEAKKHFVLLTEHGEVTETGVEETSIRFDDGQVFTVPTRYVVTIKDLSSVSTRNVITELLGDLSERFGRPEPDQKP